MFLFNRSAKTTAAYQHIDTTGYKTQFHGSDHTLVDVRTRGEFAGGHIPGALNIPLDQLGSRINEVPKGKPVIVVCATGNRSQTGSKILVNGGWTEVYNLKGGTMSWMMQGLPLDK